MALTATMRCIFSGHLVGGEKFAWGVWVNLDAPMASQADSDAIATSISTIFTANASDIASLLGTTSGYDTLTTYSYGPGGTLLYKSSVACSKPGTGTYSLPSQTCVVGSLRTATQTARGRGRVYLPANGVLLTAGQLTSTQAAAVAGNLALVLHRINLDTSGSRAKSVGVYSAVAGVVRTVINVIVDSRTDVQRRRADKLNIVAVATAGV